MDPNTSFAMGDEPSADDSASGTTIPTALPETPASSNSQEAPTGPSSRIGEHLALAVLDDQQISFRPFVLGEDAQNLIDRIEREFNDILVFDSPFDLPLPEEVQAEYPAAHHFHWHMLRVAFLCRIVESPPNDTEPCHVEGWRRVIQDKQRNNPAWIKRWVATYGVDGLQILSNSESEALLGVSRDYLRRRSGGRKLRYLWSLQRLVEGILSPGKLPYTRKEIAAAKLTKLRAPRRRPVRNPLAHPRKVPRIGGSPLRQCFTPDNMGEEDSDESQPLSSVDDTSSESDASSMDIDDFTNIMGTVSDDANWPANATGGNSNFLHESGIAESHELDEAGSYPHDTVESPDSGVSEHFDAAYFDAADFDASYFDGAHERRERRHKRRRSGYLHQAFARYNLQPASSSRRKTNVLEETSPGKAATGGVMSDHAVDEPVD
ncbi:hypothetical protein N656DRAFT_799446 [Canariomyces notabilis]|uniref:Uncharacterized protein n=1 Tax=Canariomyces notabilis TaxID=2074819 RepID=A0AAN6YPN5_9PEZI|nr:hypothetical protein N656DRAFT_799446 [Canariomyces arenarius]